MTSPAVLSAIDNGIGRLTLNQPDNKNALSPELVNALGDGLQNMAADSSVRVIVLSNAGNTFCAGADLKSQGVSEPRFNLVELFELMQAAPKPIIGCIAGHCMGGGVGLAAACDISVASEEILVGFTEVRIGVAPAIISVVCLPKMRQADAMELFLSGERISAAHAVEVGLLNYAVADDEINDKVKEITDKLVRGGPIALAAAKRLVREVPGQDQSHAFEWTAKLSAELFGSAEAKEGIAAFKERRAADWIPDENH